MVFSVAQAKKGLLRAAKAVTWFTVVRASPDELVLKWLARSSARSNRNFLPNLIRLIYTNLY
jgi:hypothetical protein